MRINKKNSKLIFAKKATTLLPGKTEEGNDLAFNKFRNIGIDTILESDE